MKQTSGPLVLVVGGLTVVLASLLPSWAEPAEVAKPTVDLAVFGRVAQVGWVVKDLDSVVGYWEMLGLKNIHRGGVVELKDVIYRGRKTPLSLKLAVGQIGDVKVEWIQPVKGKSIFDEFLSKHGDGIYSLGFAVSSPEKLHEELRYFKSKGVTLVQQGTGQAATGQSHYAFLDLGPQGAGLALEISYNPDVLPAGAKSENEYPLNQLTHFAMVARDLNKMGSFYERLGFGGVEPIGPITLKQPTYRDQPGKYDFKLGWWHWQRTSIELIEPTAGPSIYDEHLKEHGEGLQHIGFTVSDMDAALERMKGKGVAVAQGGGWDAPAGIGRFAYFDTEEHGGITLEFVWSKPRNP